MNRLYDENPPGCQQQALYRMPFVEDVTDSQLKAIGFLDVLAAAGLILPGIAGIAPVLVPVAAIGVVLLLAGAVAVHARRSETQQIVMNIVLNAIAAFIAWGRLGDYPL